MYKPNEIREISITIPYMPINKTKATVNRIVKNMPKMGFKRDLYSI